VNLARLKMSTALQNVIRDVLRKNRREKKLDVKTFVHFLRSDPGQTDFTDSILHHLACAVDEQQQSAFTDNNFWGKPSKGDRDDRNVFSKDKDMTTAFVNKIDNSMQKLKTCAVAMAPVAFLVDGSQNYSDIHDNTVGEYHQWFQFLTLQCCILFHLDRLRDRNVSHCMVGNGDPDTLQNDLDAHFVSAHIQVDAEEAPHMSFVEHNDTGAQYVSVEELRYLVLFRVHHCLITRAVTGAFIRPIDYYTELQQKIFNAALSRQLVSFGLQRVRGLHNMRPALSYKEILQQLAEDSPELRDYFALSEEEFAQKVLNYGKVKEHNVNGKFVQLVEKELDRFDAACRNNGVEWLENLQHEAQLLDEQRCSRQAASKKQTGVKAAKRKRSESTAKSVPGNGKSRRRKDRPTLRISPVRVSTTTTTVTTTISTAQPVADVLDNSLPEPPPPFVAPSKAQDGLLFSQMPDLFPDMPDADVKSCSDCSHAKKTISHLRESVASLQGTNSTQAQTIAALQQELSQEKHKNNMLRKAVLSKASGTKKCESLSQSTAVDFWVKNVHARSDKETNDTLLSALDCL